MKVKLFTIGFTKKTAKQFFGSLKAANVTRVIDTRLNRKSQLAGFAKESDLPFFLNEICHIDYNPIALLAPTDDILKAYQQKKISWDVYATEYRSLISNRAVETEVNEETLQNACLLCSEDKPHHCHRRLLAEYLQEKFGNIEIAHL